MCNYSNFVVDSDNAEFFSNKNRNFVIIYNDSESLKHKVTNYRFSFYLFNYKLRDGKTMNAIIAYCGDGFKRDENDLVKFSSGLKYKFSEVKKSAFNTTMDNFVKKYFGDDVVSYHIVYNCKLDYHRVGTTIEMRNYDELINNL